MSDYGARYADKKIAQVSRKLRAEYAQAEKELRKKLADFMRKSAAKDKYKQAQLKAGVITQEEYESWLKGQVFQKERWQAKVSQVQQVMTEHNEQAMKIINENKVDVYNENYLYQSFEMEGVTGYSFDFSNPQTIAKLIKDRDKLLPEWKIDEEKDYKWNYDKVNSSILQGIIQGEGVEKVMERLTDNLCTQNENKMRMFARTAINAAQSAGRQQQMEDAEKEFGIKQKKEWLATLDMRTRDSHRHLDGQQVDIDKPFKSDFGDIMFPGDPEAEPADVFNCRCTIITIYPEYQDEQDNWRENETVDGMTYEEWKEGKNETIEEKQKEKVIGSASGIIEKTSKYNEKQKKYDEKIKRLDDEYSNLYTQSLMKYGTDEYDSIVKRMDQIDIELAKLREKSVLVQADRDRYLAGSGEKEIKKFFGEINGKHNAAIDAKSVNMITADPRTQYNCASCVLAYDARRRGIDSEARLSYGTNNGEVETWWKGIKFQHTAKYWGTDAREEIRNIANQWGEGARGIVQVDWSATTGHYFAFEVVNGRCMFIDPQTGIINTDDLFDSAVPGSIQYARTDDKMLTKAALFGMKGKNK